jgi:two-component system, OmpR family, alkaline phosphatase synthesis response regulator PhoP
MSELLQPQPEKARYRALIVEDDPAIRRLVSKLLLRSEVDIETASDGRIAIEKLRSGSYSVMVLDLMVPEVNGFELIEFVKQEKIDLPIAVVSAVSQQALTQLDLDVVKLVISKPFDVDEFTKAILAICQERDQA